MRDKKDLFCFYAFVFVTLFWVSTNCLAHRLNVFAWVERDRIEVEAKFLGGVKAQNAQVELVDSNGKILKETTTDTAGKASLVLPEGFNPQPLTVVVSAGEGHKNQWHIPAGDFSTSSVPKVQDLVTPLKSASKEEKLYSQTQLEEALRIQQTKIDSDIIAPLRKALAEAQEPKIGLREIMGGVGWIVGLFGILAWFVNRRKK